MNIFKNKQPLDHIYLATGDHDRKPTQPYGYLTKELSENAKKHKHIFVKLKKHDNKIYNLWDYVNNNLNKLQNLKAQEYNKKLSDRLGEASQKIEMERKQLQMQQLIAHFKNSLFAGMAEKASKELISDEVENYLKNDPTIINAELEANEFLKNAVALNEIRQENDLRIGKIYDLFEKTEKNFMGTVNELNTPEDLENISAFAERLDEMREQLLNVKQMNEDETVEGDVSDLENEEIETLMDEIIENIENENKQKNEIDKTEEDVMNLNEEIMETQENSRRKTQEENDLLDEIKRSRNAANEIYNKLQDAKVNLPLKINNLLKTFGEKTDLGLVLKSDLSSGDVQNILKSLKKNYFLENVEIPKIDLRTNKAVKISNIDFWMKMLRNGELYDLEKIMDNDLELIKKINFKKEGKPKFMERDTRRYAKLNLEQRKELKNKYDAYLNQFLGKNLELPQSKALTRTPAGTSDLISGAITKMAATPADGEEGSSGLKR